MTYSEGFSIVLCTYNGCKRIGSTLNYIALLDKPLGYDVELILVDNASSDGTGTFASAHWDKLGAPFPLKVIEEKYPGKGFAVETGYDAAAYTYIVTVDDDNWLAADYLLQAVAIFQQHADVGILQGRSIASFEVEPPYFVSQWDEYFIIGSPTNNEGYFPEDNFYVWGAGMVLKKIKWDYIRQFGFKFLTSKISGKAAGEDNETALAFLLLGEKIYYSSALVYQHYMPKERLTWIKLRQNFETFGYVSYYFFLYALAIDSYYNNYKVSEAIIFKKFMKKIFNLKDFTIKQHIYYWVRPMNEMYQLELSRRYHCIKWFLKLHTRSMNDIKTIQRWLVPLMQQNLHQCEWYKKLV